MFLSKTREYLEHKRQARTVRAVVYRLDRLLSFDNRTYYVGYMCNLLYYCQAMYSVFHRKHLFPDKIEAWTHGAGIDSVYKLLKKGRPIWNGGDVYKHYNAPQHIVDLVVEVYDVYGKLDKNKLEILITQEEPWKNARKGLDPFEAGNTEITLKSMRKYYKKKIKRCEKEG